MTTLLACLFDEEKHHGQRLRNMGMKHAEVYGYGVIIEHPSGVMFGTQAGGMACDHPSVEGVFIPLPPDPPPDPGDLPHVGCWGEWSDEDTVAMAKHFRIHGLLFDESRKDAAMEAWIPVIIGPEVPHWSGERMRPRDKYNDLYEFIGARAWLITENCD